MKSEYFLSRDKCPACSSDSFKDLYQKPFDEPPVSEYLKWFYSHRGGVEFEYLKNASYHLCECNQCNLIFQKEIGNDFLMELLYEKWLNPEKVFQQYERKNKIEMYSRYSQEISTIIAYFDKEPSKLSFFDFGMGWGKWSIMAKGFGCDSYGSELSEERIKYATSKGVKVITWDEMPEHNFDFVNTEQVFEHIPEPLETLEHLKKSLKPKGIIKISVPTENDIKRRLKRMDWTARKLTRNSLNAVAPLEHINFYRRSSIIKMAEKVGLEEILMPMKLQYRYASDWYWPRGLAKNLVLPIYRNILKRQNYLFFRIK